MTAGLYCRARIDRRTIRRHDADQVDTPIDPGFLGLRGPLRSMVKDEELVWR